MSKLFLDKDQPLSICKEETCENCEVGNKLVCHFNEKKLALFIGSVMPAFIFGAILIGMYNPWFIIPWLGTCFLFFGLVEIRVMCSHCPHYAEPEINSLKCWANYGSPKIWKYRPGPMSSIEKFVFFAGFFVIFAYPVVFSFLNSLWILLLCFGGAVVFFSIMLRRYYCSRCMNFACPLNKTDEKTRELFWEKVPSDKEHWQKP
jgi:hypothetical protein